MFNTNSILINSDNLHTFLKNNSYLSFLNGVKPFWLNTAKNSYIIRHEVQQRNFYSIRIWQTEMYSSLSREDMKTDKNFGAADYKLNKDDDNMKIEYLYGTDEAMISSLVKYLENTAKENGITKLKLDVHSNLKNFNTYFKPNGFCTTDLVCKDNPYWIQTEKILKNDEVTK